MVTASTAEAQLVEVLEGALSVMQFGGPGRSFGPESKGRVFFRQHGINRYHGWSPRKRANIRRTKAVQGDRFLRHIPGVELPADLGTKILSFEKFQGHKRLMGMFWEMMKRKVRKNRMEFCQRLRRPRRH